MRRWAALPLLLAGCTSLQPAYDRPVASVPLSWPAGDAYLAQSEASLAALTYADVFRDPRLQGLIAQALDNNRDLAVAVANIAITRAQYRIQRSGLLPDVGATAGLTVGRRSGGGGAAIPATGAVGGGGVPVTGGTGGVNGGGAGSGAVAGAGGASTYSIYTANVGVTSYELDLFGRVRSLSEAALNQYLASESAARSTRLTLVGDLATAWSTYAADRELLSIARDTVASAGRSVELTRLRLEGGVAPRTDLRQAQSVLETANSDLAAARTAVAQDRNAVERLVGAPIMDAQLPGGVDALDGALGPVPAGLASSILLRRPDVVEAEYRLIAANANIGAARAALFPRLSLTGLLGLASTSLTGLFDTGAFSASAGPSVALPIFDGGARRAGVAQSVAQRDQLVYSYQATLQTAFREVADALARRGTVADQIAADERLRASAADNYELATARYRGGIDTFLISLDAQRTLYDARRRLVGTRLTAAANLVTLYVALGGDPALAGLPLEPAAPSAGPVSGADPVRAPD